MFLNTSHRLIGEQHASVQLHSQSSTTDNLRMLRAIWEWSSAIPEKKRAWEILRDIQPLAEIED